MTKTIGLDIGGTKIQGAVIDENGEILKTYRLETCAREGKDKVLENISKIIEFLKTDEIEAIGVGAPGFIDSENGIVTFAGNIDGWTGLNLKKELENISGLPVFVENDANIDDVLLFSVIRKLASPFDRDGKVHFLKAGKLGDHDKEILKSKKYQEILKRELFYLKLILEKRELNSFNERFVNVITNFANLINDENLNEILFNTKLKKD